MLALNLNGYHVTHLLPHSRHDGEAVILAERYNPDGSVDEYVTAVVDGRRKPNGDEPVAWGWGHYFTNRAEALADFHDRASGKTPPDEDDVTVTFTPDAQETLRACLIRVEETMRYPLKADSYEELARRREVVITQMWSLLRALGYSLLVSNRHDRNVRLSRDGERSIFFQFDSGYHGAVIFHDVDGKPECGTWSTHT